MANTTNLDLVKPAGTDLAQISVINGNMDKVDAYAGNVNGSLSAIENGIAIVSVGDTHGAITSGQYVYVKEHSTLPEGMYTASSNIAANGALSTSNLTAVSSGALNVLSDKIGDLSNLGTSEKSSVVGSINELSDKIGDLSNLGTSEKSSVVGSINELVGNRVKKRTFSMTASEVKSITDLPSRYMLFANGSSTSQLGIWVGTGYGSTTSRHILKEITGNSACNISVTVGSSVYGLNITNSSNGSTNFTLVEMA